MDVKRNMRKVSRRSRGILAKLGPLLFLLGVIIAIVVGLLIGAEMLEATENNDTWGLIAGALAVLGVVVGMITILGTGTITKEEMTPFLIGSIALVVVGIAGQETLDIPYIGAYLSGVTLCMILFFAPAAVIIALKSLWDLGKD